MSTPEAAAGPDPRARAAADGFLVVQTLVLPEAGLLEDPALFVHLSGGARIGGGVIHLSPGARVVADGWMNLFARGLWQRAAHLEGLVLRLTGTGRVTAEIRSLGCATVWDGRGPPPRAETAPVEARWSGAARAGIGGPPLAPWTPGPLDEIVLLSRDMDLSGAADAPGVATIPLDDLPAPEGAGLIAFALTAGPEGARIDAAAFLAAARPAALAAETGSRSDGARSDGTRVRAPGKSVRLAIAITTYRREAALAQTVARICVFLDAAAADAQATGSPGRDPADDPVDDLTAARLIVIDNGGTAALPAHPRLTSIANRNLGGAGGFARALAAARTGGFTHCLFMDDDAAFPMENLRRTAAFLRLARSDRAAVAGAMISAARPTAMWENGALFDRLCRPLFNNIDLTDTVQVAAMEEVAARPKPAGFYGGFWYCAFPLDAVRHDPFPFFVRGDDISFSLANAFDTVTLPGVVSVQEDFGHKESPHTLYLDLRNHLHHHLTQPGMEIGAWRTAGIVWRFVLRSLFRMHYASIAAQCLAWEDVMRGPALFEDTADMSARRPALAALAAPEAWVPDQDADGPAGPGAEPALHRPPSRLWARAMQASLNGHLVPFWALIAGRRRIGLAERALIWPLWGASRATFVDTAGGRSYSVRHDKRRAWALIRRALGLTWRWRRDYPALVAAYRAAYGPMTAPEAWQARFRGDRPDAPPATLPAEVAAPRARQAG